MRILFAGTPEIAVPSLRKLHASFSLCGVLTKPDRPQGRGNKLQAGAVKKEALASELPLFQPSSLHTAFEEEIRALRADLLVAVAYGKIFKPSFLSLFPQGGLNLHPSALPLYRGPSPLRTALLNGDRSIGLSVQALAEEMDSGDLYARETRELSGDETYGDLLRYAGEAGALLLEKVITRLQEGKAERTPQDHGRATFCTFIEKKGGEACWNEPASVLYNRFRAYSPHPGFYTFWKGKRLNLREAALAAPEENRRFGSPAEPGRIRPGDRRSILVQTGEGLLKIKRLQAAGKKPLTAEDFLNGNPDLLKDGVWGSLRSWTESPENCNLSGKDKLNTN